MGRVVAGDIGVVVGQVGADQLAVDALEVVEGLAVGRVDDEVEVAGVHAEGTDPGADHLVGAEDRIRGEDGRQLGVVLAHDLEPAHVRAGSGVADDVGWVDRLRRVQGRGEAVLVGRDDQAAVIPVVEVGRRVAPHAPVPDAAAGSGALLFSPYQ